MNRRTRLGWVGALTAVAGTGLVYAAMQLLFSPAVNVSNSPDAASDKARIARLSYSDGAGNLLTPYLIVYGDATGTAGAFNLYARRSFDAGLSWDGPTLLSRDALGNPTGGQAINVQGTDFIADNDKPNLFAPQSYASGAARSLLVSWVSSYCPDLVTGAYPNIAQKIATAMVPPQPYRCVWTARSTDAGETWTTEQLTDATRDAINDVVAGSQSNNAFALAWQEDPLGLQPGEDEGPGDGGSGAHTTAGTNIWYTHAPNLQAAASLRAGIVQLSDNTAGPNPGDGPPIGPGASRPTLQMSGSTAAIVYEESKGGVAAGKNVIYHAFAYNNPDVNSAGTVVSDPDRNSRRARLALQGDSAAAGSPLRAVVFYRQAVLLLPGAASDVILHRGLKDTLADPASTGFRPQDLEPYASAQNLSDTGAADNALAHRVILRGSFLALGYTHTPDMLAADGALGTPTATYNFFVRTSSDSGASWGQARNVSNILNPMLAVREPRLVPTPATVAGSSDPHDIQNPGIFFVAFGTYINDAIRQDYRVFVTRSTDLGASYETPATAPGSMGQLESQLRPLPDGSGAAILWMQNLGGGDRKDVMFATAVATEVPDTLPAGANGGGCFIATAAWGTPMQEEVRYLRAFRDQYLLGNEPGRAFVALYYKYSPPVADFIRKHDTLRAMVRTGLEPLVLLSRQLVSAPATEAGQ